MPGLIEQVLKLGLEREELRKDHPKALIGGARIPFPPKDMASIISVCKGPALKTYLALEATTPGGVDFLVSHLKPQRVLRVDELDEKTLKKMLRTLPEPVDLLSLDTRNLPLNGETIWKYILGGKDKYATAWGAGAPPSYGIPKLRPGGYMVINLADEAAREVWFRARARFNPTYLSAFVGVVRVASL